MKDLREYSNDRIRAGIDIVEVSRIRDAALKRKGGFLDKIFTRHEQAYASRCATPYQHLAARFAAKEAVLKAFGGGHGKGIPWTNIEIRNTPFGQPNVHLHGRMKALQTKLHVKDIAVSMSHTRTYAVASVVVIRKCGVV